MTEKTFPAKDTALSAVLSFAEEKLRKAGCPRKAVMPITVALEEIFINIAHYAYPHRSGEVNLAIDYDSESRTMTFQMTDSGIPFAPCQSRILISPSRLRSDRSAAWAST